MNTPHCVHMQCVGERWHTATEGAATRDCLTARAGVVAGEMFGDYPGGGGGGVDTQYVASTISLIIGLTLIS